MAHQSWELRDFVISGIMAAMGFAIAFFLGSGLILATGITATGGIANIIAVVFILVIGLKLVPKFGYAILTLGLLFTIAVPTVIGGPPGIYKIVIGLAIGVVADTIVTIGRRTRLSHIVAGSFGAMTSILSIYAALIILNLPGVEKLTPLLIPLTAMQAITGAIGAWAGISLFDRRLSKLSAVKRLLGKP